MELPGDYCITITARWYRRPLMVAPWRKPLSAMTTYRFLEKLSSRSRFSFPRPGPHPRCTPANRDISYYTVHESFVATIPLVFCEAEKMDPNTSS